jgi:hypothetical protein
VALVALMSKDSPSNEPRFSDRYYNVTISLNGYLVNVKFLTLKGVIGKVLRCNSDLSVGTSLRLVSIAKCAEEGE